jgi:hypothetical protein
MYSVYILYSLKADRYYVGHTADIDLRLCSHHHFFHSLPAVAGALFPNKMPVETPALAR